MKNMFKKLAAATLVGAMALSTTMTSMTAYAATVRDGASNLTEGPATGATATDDTSSFVLIKDYDSKNPNASTAPLSESPAETFEYKITPYAVWNAGYTYANGATGDNAFTGAATKITKANMPMLTSSVTTDTLTGTGDARTLTIKQDAPLNYAKYEASDDKENAATKDTVRTTINLPTYDTVGDYWYQVVETLGNTTGVFYGTNSVTLATSPATEEVAENGSHGRTYYIHVQVTENNTTAGQSTLVKNVTMHTTAPQGATDADYNKFVSDNNFYKNDTALTHKVNAIENRYYAGDLVINKIVTGNAGDKDKYFKVTVVFTKPAGTVANSDIIFNAVLKDGDTYTPTNCTVKGQYYTGAASSNTIKWTTADTTQSTATCVFYVKDKSKVTFSNIPYGINYSIVEEKPADDNSYQNVITFTPSTKDAASPKFDNQALTADTDSAAISADFSKTAVGSISDIHDEVTIENKKETTIDIGVILSNAPYIAMLVLAAGAVFILIRRRKNHIED